MRPFLTAILAALVGIGALTAVAPGVRAATYKVVIVVGPTGSSTANYRYNADILAKQAASYGAVVVKLYSPNATWSRVSSAAHGANVLIYLGHGNGWPSPYYPFSTARMDGLGLNATLNAGNSNTKYYGEAYMPYLHLAPNAVVILNRLCYASGDSEWGAANPTKATAIKRVDNYGAGFLRSGAKAVFASGITSVSYVLRGLFRGSASMTMSQLFWSDPSKTVSYKIAFTSTRTPGATALMDPYAPSRYYRSVIGKLGTTVGNWRSG
ncbi:MAG TPA: hypothetical protein VIR16_10595 [Candidatus Limnocylindrales bacterium]